MGASTEKSILEPLALHEQTVVGASEVGSIWNGIIKASRHIYILGVIKRQSGVCIREKGIKRLLYQHAYEGHRSTEDTLYKEDRCS